MRYLSGDIIYPIHLPPIPGGIIVVNERGEIRDLLDPAKQEIPEVEVEKFSGLLCPGLVNAHCHLELSHLLGKITRGNKLHGFIAEIVMNRAAPQEEINDAMEKADAMMFRQGIVAVGDISNEDDSILIKRSSRIHYHTFVEIFDLHPDRAEVAFSEGRATLNKFTESGLRASIAPHAPYSVSPRLLQLISEFAKKSGAIISIHNQETEGEMEMFKDGRGPLLDQLKGISPTFNEWVAPGISSMQYILRSIDAVVPIQLVHNTFTVADECEEANRVHKKIYWCTCPKANLYIEGRLPDLTAMSQKGCLITVGTDSLASNDTVSILEEIKTISASFQGIQVDELLKWATWNGAKILNMDDKFGTLEKGKSPGINRISGQGVESGDLANAIIERVV